MALRKPVIIFKNIFFYFNTTAFIIIYVFIFKRKCQKRKLKPVAIVRRLKI